MPPTCPLFFWLSLCHKLFWIPDSINRKPLLNKLSTACCTAKSSCTSSPHNSTSQLNTFLRDSGKICQLFPSSLLNRWKSCAFTIDHQLGYFVRATCMPEAGWSALFNNLGIPVYITILEFNVTKENVAPLIKDLNIKQFKLPFNLFGDAREHIKNIVSPPPDQCSPAGTWDQSLQRAGREIAAGIINIPEAPIVGYSVNSMAGWV